jgi:hypothetical protein
MIHRALNIYSISSAELEKSTVIALPGRILTSSESTSENPSHLCAMSLATSACWYLCCTGEGSSAHSTRSVLRTKLLCQHPAEATIYVTAEIVHIHREGIVIGIGIVRKMIQAYWLSSLAY